VSEDWKVGYKRAMLNEFGRSAYALRTNDGDRYYGGPFDYQRTSQVHEHLRGCEVDADASPMPKDVEWDQFNGTFAEDHTHHGLDGVITCRCGHLRKVRVRWEGSFTELLHGILRED